MESFEPVLDVEETQNNLQRTLDRANERIHNATDRMNDATDRIQAKSNTALRVIQHQRPPDGKSDWTDVAPEDRTPIQKIAAATHGIVTPANIVTIAGHISSFKAVRSIMRRDYVSALGESFRGRAPDTVDGLLAHATRTKSPVGAAIDSGGDNATMIPLFVALAVQNKIPADRAALLTLQRVQTVYENARIRALGEPINPSRAAKSAMSYASFYVGGVILSEAEKQKHHPVRGKVVAFASSILGEMAILRGQQAVDEYHQRRLTLEAQAAASQATQ